MSDRAPSGSYKDALMAIVSAREFNPDVSAAKRAAAERIRDADCVLGSPKGFWSLLLIESCQSIWQSRSGRRHCIPPTLELFPRQPRGATLLITGCQV